MIIQAGEWCDCDATNNFREFQNNLIIIKWIFKIFLWQLKEVIILFLRKVNGHIIWKLSQEIVQKLWEVYW